MVLILVSLLYFCWTMLIWTIEISNRSLLPLLPPPPISYHSDFILNHTISNPFICSSTNLFKAFSKKKKPFHDFSFLHILSFKTLLIVYLHLYPLHLHFHIPKWVLHCWIILSPPSYLVNAYSSCRKAFFQECFPNHSRVW